MMGKNTQTRIFGSISNSVIFNAIQFARRFRLTQMQLFYTGFSAELASRVFLAVLILFILL